MNHKTQNQRQDLGAASPADHRHGRRGRRGWLLRPVEHPPRLGAGGAGQAAGHRPDDGRLRPVRRQRRHGAAGRDDGHQGVQRQGRRAGPAHRGHPHGHRDHAGHRLARGRAHDQPQRRGLPDRRGALGRGQRHLAGGAEVRLHLPQHQLQLAHRIGQGLPPRQVRVGRQRHQLRAGHRQERDQGQRQGLGAADQRLRLGPQHLEGHARHRRGQRRQASSKSCWCRRTRATSRPSCSSCSSSSPTWWPRPSAATTSRRCASRWCSWACRRTWPGSTTSRTGPTSTAWGRSRSSASSAPPGTTGSTCRA